LFQNARQAMANQDAGIARARMDGTRWENGPCTFSSVQGDTKKTPYGKQQEAFQDRTAERKRNSLFID
jgi:hypothetical protein